MDCSIEALKQVNLVEFLSRHYGLKFQRRGAAFACLSPFTEESSPSFFVRLVDGHWLFKDFSGGSSGTIFDFVRMKEKLGSFSEAWAFVRKLVSGVIFFQASQGEGDDAAAPSAVTTWRHFTIVSGRKTWACVAGICSSGGSSRNWSRN
jgi:hypothetical protein